MSESKARRVESSADDVMTGAQRATHHVIVWLRNDRPLARRAKKIVRGDDFWERALAAHVFDWLYSPRGVQVLADLGGSLSAATKVRESFTREDFNGIDWAAVRESLLGE